MNKGYAATIDEGQTLPSGRRVLVVACSSVLIASESGWPSRDLVGWNDFGRSIGIGN